MLKQIVINSLAGIPISCSEVRSFDDPKEIEVIKKKCESNALLFLDRIDELERKVIELQLKLARDEGEITEEEYLERKEIANV